LLAQAEALDPTNLSWVERAAQALLLAQAVALDLTNLSWAERAAQALFPLEPGSRY
jgi:hypothetical protein